MSIKYLFVAALLAFGGCKRERERTPDRTDDRVAARDPEQPEAARDEFIRSAREQMRELNARIDQLEAKADVESTQAAASLRARRDALAARMDRAADIAAKDWDQFKADVDRGMTDLRDELDKRF